MFGIFASLFLFAAGIIVIFRGGTQLGLYLLLISSLFYIGRAIIFHSETFLKLIKSITDATNTIINLKKEENE